MLKTKNKFRLITTIISVGIMLIPQLSFSQSFVNLGNLDVKLTDGKEQINLVLNNGNKTQEKLRISNFSNQTKKLNIYVADAKQTNSKNYIAYNRNQLSEDIFPWIKIPTNYLELKSGESKIISVNIIIPENAGVGIHTGAIMVSEDIKSSTDDQINLEKGIRVSVNIKGNPMPNLNIIDSSTSESERFIGYSAKAINNGNTDLRGTFKSSILNSNNEIISEQSQSLFLKPKQSTNVNLFTEKPTFGLYKIETTQNLIKEKTYIASYQKIFFPTLPIYLVLTLLLIISIYKIKKNYNQLPFKYSRIFSIYSSNKFAFQSSLAFFGLLAITITITSSLHANTKQYLADILNTPSLNGYITTIKWGNMEKLTLPEKYHTNWHGNIGVKFGTMTIKEKLNLEETDKIYLNKDQTVLSFNNQTGQDNDGIILQIDPTSPDKMPIITYTNLFSGENYEFPINNNIYNKKTFRYLSHSIAFNTIIPAEKISVPVPNIIDSTTNNQLTPSPETPITDITTTTDINISPSLESTPNINIATTSESSPNIDLISTTSESSPNLDTSITNEINNIASVIKDIPTATDQLSNYILDSNYIQEINSTESSATIQTDPLIINALKESPEAIKDITSSPDLNFVFIPNNKITFAPQQFSFDQRHLTTQEIGEIIFVQNKQSAWNTYITVSDFTSISGKGTIPASAITIIPGEIKILSQNNIQSDIQQGTEKKLDNANDNASLVSIQPQNDSQAVFTMHPKASIEIPPNTPPGIYHSQISIKVL